MNSTGPPIHNIQGYDSVVKLLLRFGIDHFSGLRVGLERGRLHGMGLRDQFNAVFRTMQLGEVSVPNGVVFMQHSADIVVAPEVTLQ